MKSIPKGHHSRLELVNRLLQGREEWVEWREDSRDQDSREGDRKDSQRGSKRVRLELVVDLLGSVRDEQKSAYLELLSESQRQKRTLA